MKSERYWDPLNKAAVLVTLFTGIPSFLTFMGLPFVAAIALAVLSIGSLVFALVRSRSLREKFERTERLHDQDSVLLKRANSLILSFDPQALKDRKALKNIFTQSLRTLQELAEELCGCDARLTLFSIDHDLRATSLFSSTLDSARQIAFDLKRDTVLGSLYQEPYSALMVHLDRSGEYYRLRPDPKLRYRTVAAFPIHSIPEKTKNQRFWAGFLTLDLNKRVQIPAELQAKLAKYTHLYFLILHGIGESTVKELAHRDPALDGNGAPAESPLVG